MLDGMTIRESINQEIKKIEGMNGRKRWEYFKTYYLAKTIIAFGIAIMLLHLVYSIHLGGREVLASGCLVNVEISDNGERFLTDEYVTFCGESEKDAVAYVSLGNRFDFSGDHQIQDNAYEIALLAQISAGEYQYMILDEQGLKYFMKLDVYSNLDNVLTDSQKERLSQRMVYQTLQDGKTQTAFAICLRETEFAQKYQLYQDEAYLVLIDVNQDIEKACMLVDYITGG